jgi:hypothetical protein
MGQTLKLHPGSSCAAIAHIEVEAERPAPRTLRLSYRAAGRMADVRIPPRAGPDRTDDLWKHTCFEAFIRAPGDEAYWELNLSPSMQWAAYAFTGYRAGGRDIDAVGPLRLEVRSDADSLALQVTVDLSEVRGLPADGPWELGLSAVIEETDGTTSYWALEHPPGKADFHHPDCFALELVAPARS